MTTSGQYAFSPSVGELVVAAYRRIQIHRSALLTEHFADAKNECNLLQVTWANLGPTLWTVDQQTIPLVQGTATYSVLPDTVMMLDVWVSTANGDGSFSDTFLTPFSRTEYASVPDKIQQGGVTTFWFNRQINPEVTFYLVPDGTQAAVNYFRFTQIQDALLTNATTPQVPYLWLDAWVAGLAHRLSRLYKPDLEAAREADAVKAYNVASTQGTENVALFIGPTTYSYWNN